MRPLLSVCVLLLRKTANAEDLFGDADDISSVSSHENAERGETDMVCKCFVLLKPTCHIDCAVPKGYKRHFCHFLLFRDYDTTANNTSPVIILEASCAWK